MEDFLYPVEVEGEWGCPNQKVKTKLQIYFQSKKKSNGGDCVVEYNEVTRRFIVRFKSDEVRRKVLEKGDHETTIENKEVKLRVNSSVSSTQAEPPQTEGETSKLSDIQGSGSQADGDLPTGAEGSPQQPVIVLEKVTENFTEEMLVLMVENISDLTEADFSLEMIYERQTAVVSFKNTNDATQFLLKCGKNNRFQQSGFNARLLERTRSVRVENLPPHVMEDMLQLYFERKKEGGGDIEDIKMIPEEQAAIVTFLDPEVTETIRGRKHHISKVPVNVYPFYTSIGTALYGKDRPRWKLPDPFTESIHPAAWKFLQKRNEIRTISKEMSKYFCEVHLDTSDVKLTPLPTLLKQKCLSVKHIDSWKKNATDAFQNIMTKYKTTECVVNNPVWTVAEKEISSVAKQDVILLHDQTKGVLTVAGLVQDVDRLKQVVEGIVHKVTNQIERATQIVSEELQVPPGMFYILQQDGLQQEASHYPEMTYAYKSDVKKLILSGLPLEVLHLKSWIFEHQLKMKQKQVEIEPDILSFLSAVNSEEMSSHLFTSCGIAAVYGVDGSNVVLTGNSDKTLADAQRRLRDALTFQNIVVKDQAVLSRPEWQILHEKLKDTYSSSKKNTVTIKLTAQDRITVSGFCEDVKEVCESLSDFINRYTRVQEVVQVQSAAVVKFIQEKKIQTASDGDLPTGAEGSPQQPVIFLEKVTENFTEEMLVFMVENISDLTEADFSLEMIYERQTAVVSFKNTNDATQFLLKCGKNNRFQKYGFNARLLERTRSVRVENLPPHVMEDILQLYFERKKEGGGDIEAIKMIPEEQAAIVTFLDPEVTETIRRRKHHIYQVPVNIYPFYTSIGTALYGKDRPRWKLPDPFTESIHPAAWKFLQKRNEIRTISKEMSKYFCEVHLDTSDVKLTPLPTLLKQKCLSVKHIDSWKKNATDAFQNIMTKYKTSECVVNNPVWTVAEKEISSLAKQDVILLHDQTKGVLTVAGLVQDVDRLKQVVEGIVHKVTNQIERATQSVSEELQVPPGMFYILQQDGLQQEASHYPEMTYAYKSDVKKLILSGLPLEVLHLKSWIFEHQLKMKQKQVEIEPDILSFLSAVNSEEMSSHLFTSCGIAAVYGIDGSNVVLTGNSDKTLADAQRRLRDTLTFQNIAVKDQAVLRRPEWQILHKKLKDTYSSSKKNTVTIKLTAQDRITVSGFCEDVKEVCESLSDFINKDTRVQEVVQVQSAAVVKFIQEKKIQTWKTFLTSKDAEVFFESKRPRIQLNGTQYSVQEVKSFFQKIVNSLHVDFLKIVKPGATKYFLEKQNVFSTLILRDTNCMVVLQEDVIPEEMEKCFRRQFADYKLTQRGRYGQHDEFPQATGPTIPLQQSSSGFFSQISTPSLGVYMMRVGSLMLEVSSGDITKQNTDAIVNSSNESFTLKTGVSRAILMAAGFAVEDECKRLGSQPHKGYLLTQSGQLSCKNIIHIVGQTDPNKIKEVVYKVLQVCEEKRFISVSFPAIGTGAGGVSPSLVADAMINTVVDFEKIKKGQSLKCVKIVVFQAGMMADFHRSLKTKEGTDQPEENSIFSRIKDTITNVFGGISVPPEVEEDFTIVGEKFAPAIFQFCGESHEEVSKAKKYVQDLIMKEQMEHTIKDSCIGLFTQEDCRKLQVLQKKLTVSIHLEKRGADSVIQLEGLSRDVLTANDSIKEMMRKVESLDRRKREAALVGAMVEWQHDSSGTFLSFDSFTNLILEQAFDSRCTKVKININNLEYMADLTSMEAVSGRQIVKLKRKEKKVVEGLLGDWDDMKGYELLEVTLGTSSTEYQQVEAEFRKTGLSNQIIKIVRIQNNTLWKNYQIKKDGMDKKNKHSNNERWLFHGTCATTISHINSQGFNRSYAGKNAAMIGNGTYFAVDPKYSASHTYSKPDAQGHKNMYWARVLVGDFTQGSAGLVVPPVKRSGNGSDLYDSVVDNVGSPQMFVIFHDVQAYPEYLITFH
ncbi:protein mono-ADP-ribosyltransferase PARP14-like [Paramormyrops kingsleyae]|uniref:protein mono-ADP-ribosyltransferase PARP14-like n=1 Tax=Paramormyrops kingsleyae TaxID=1676925 RepID=UPI003B96ABE7